MHRDQQQDGRHGGREERATLSVPEAARWLGISRNAAYEACRRGEIPCIHIGNRILIPRARLQALLDGVAAVA